MTFQTFHYDLLIQLATACCLLLFLTSTTTAFTTNQPYYYANTIAKSPAAILRTTSIHNTPFVLRKSQYTPSKFNCFTRLFLSSSSTSPLTEPDLQSNDPFRILGLDPNHPEALDKKVIKRAYKKMALKYHPDVTTTRDSTPEEKRQAGDTFAKINAAYQTLSSGNVGASASSSRSSSGSSTGWEPPHRRSGGYQSRRGSDYSDYKTTGTTWEDFMPKYNDEDYDAGGDSFAAIFSDLLAGAAGAAAGYGGGNRGGGGIFTDFVEFLEQNIDGYGDFSSTGIGSSTASAQDADLTYLLQTGSIQEVGEELDETELVVQQLSSKLSDLQSELLGIKADLAAASKFSEKIKLEEQQSECMARTKVVEKYLAQARKRLLKLQTRYKELIVGGANDPKAGGGARDRSGYGGSNYNSGSGYSNSNARTSTTSSTTTSSSSTASTRTTSTDPEDAWKSEGFGSSGGRGRGSSRRRGASAAGRRTTSNRETVNNSQSSSSSGGTSSSSSGTYSNSGSNTNEPSRRQSTYNSSSTSSSGGQSTSPRSTTPSASSSTDYVPPHRRSPSYDQRVQDDKKRLRELQVEDEFQKLKKELGL